MYIQASKHIVLRLFQNEINLYIRRIRILFPTKSGIWYIGLIFPCESDNCRCAKPPILFAQSTRGAC